MRALTDRASTLDDLHIYALGVYNEASTFPRNGIYPFQRDIDPFEALCILHIIQRAWIDVL